MPARDRVHVAFTTALNKDAWTITEEQVMLYIAARRLFIDIRAEKQDQSLAVMIEIKGFENMNSPVDYLMHTVGQYIVYRTALIYLNNPTPLYLAVPIHIYYGGILSEPLGVETIVQNQIKIVVFDVEREKIVEWIPER